MPEIVKYFEVYCAVCGTGMCNNTEVLDGHRPAMLKITPCEKCSEREQEKGYDKGYEEGYADGHDAGREAQL